MKGMVKKRELGEDWGNGKPRPVKIWFNEPKDFAVFTIEELKEILRLWIIGEEEVYPQHKGFKGRWLLFDELTKVFHNTQLNKPEVKSNANNR